MNSLKETQEAIRDAAARHGFDTDIPAMRDFPSVAAENLNFLFTPTVDPTSDWKSGKVRISVAASASVSRMGGDPTPDELLRTADEIHRGAELLRELQNADLSYMVKV